MNNEDAMAGNFFNTNKGVVNISISYMAYG